MPERTPLGAQTGPTAFAEEYGDETVYLTNDNSRRQLGRSSWRRASAGLPVIQPVLPPPRLKAHDLITSQSVRTLTRVSRPPSSTTSVTKPSTSSSRWA